MFDEILYNAANLCAFTSDQQAALRSLIADIKASPERSAKVRRACEHFWQNSDPGEALRTYCDAGKTDDGTLLCVALAGVKIAEERYKKQGLPLSCLYEAAPEIRVWMENFISDYGHLGMELDYGFSWFYDTLANGIVLRFGRLEYNKWQFYPDVVTFRNRFSGERKIMLNSIGAFDAKGRIAPDAEAEGCFTTSHISGIFHDKVQGHLIDPRTGAVSPEQSQLPLSEWEYELRPGDKVVSLHIPAGEPLTGVKDSLSRMKRYFCSELSGFYPRAVVCSSWLLDPQLQEILPESSNLVQFQRHGYMLPSNHLTSDTVRRVFGLKAVTDGLHSVPWKTFLQQRIGADMDAGVRYSGGRFVIFMDEID